MTFLHALVLFVAATIGGSLNAIAGGGSLFTFPALLFTGVTPVLANTTSTVALWPGAVASVGAYRRELTHAPHRRLLSAMSLLGGTLGALLLLNIPGTIFQQAIPYLILLATVLFALPKSFVARLRQRGAESGSQHSLVILALAQLLIAIYGGFFGGGIGLLMLATLGLMGVSNITVANALKTMLASIINGVSVLVFILAHSVLWPEAVTMMGGSIVGGYVVASWARHLPPGVVRAVVIVVGVTLTLKFFVQGS